MFPLHQLESAVSSENCFKVTNSNLYITLPSFRKLVGEEKMQDNPYSLQELKECRALTFE
jgi:hypothetical protein